MCTVGIFNYFKLCIKLPCGSIQQDAMNRWPIPFQQRVKTQEICWVHDNFKCFWSTERARKASIYNKLAFTLFSSKWASKLTVPSKSICYKMRCAVDRFPSARGFETSHDKRIIMQTQWHMKKNKHRRDLYIVKFLYFGSLALWHVVARQSINIDKAA